MVIFLKWPGFFPKAFGSTCNHCYKIKQKELLTGGITVTIIMIIIIIIKKKSST